MKSLLAKFFAPLGDNFFEIMILVGLSGIFYGLFIRWEWVAYVVVGALVFLLGLRGVLPGQQVKGN